MLPGLYDLPAGLQDAFRDLARQMLEWQDEPLPTSSLTLSSEESDGEFETMEAGSGDVFPYDNCTGLDPLPIPTSYADWIAPYAVDLGGETDYADEPMHDGVPNITKYALGLDPTVGGRLCLPRPVFKEHESEIYLAVRFTQPDWITGVMHTLESSPDLVTWTQHHDAVTLTEDIADSPYEKGWIFDPEPADSSQRRFLRLRTEEDSGIYASAECVPDGGVVVTVDLTKWIDDTQLEMDQLGSVTIETASSPDGPFSSLGSGGGGGNGVVAYLDVSATNGDILYYRAYTTYVVGGSVFQSPYSNIAFVNVTCGWERPEIMTSCRPDGIVVHWKVPEWASSKDQVQIQEWILMKATPEGSFEKIEMGSDFFGGFGGTFVDEDISAGVTYSYYVYFEFTQNSVLPILTSPKSVVASESTCSPPPPKGRWISRLSSTTADRWATLCTPCGTNRRPARGTPRSTKP